MLAQLEERGLVKDLAEAVGHLVACADEVRLDEAVELALAKVVLPALVVLSLLRCASVVSLFNSCRIVHEQHGGPALKLGGEGVEEMGKKVAKKDVSLGSNTAGCNFNLARTGGKFEKTRAPGHWQTSRCAMYVWSVFQEASDASGGRVSKCGTEKVLPPSTRVMIFVEWG
eukprot:5632190-Pleurochrysis_carterae.AAC.1